MMDISASQLFYSSKNFVNFTTSHEKKNHFYVLYWSVMETALIEVLMAQAVTPVKRQL